MRVVIASAAMVFLAGYLGGYAAYRTWGPTATHYQHSGILEPPCAITDLGGSPRRRALYEIFSPCITVEDWYYAATYHWD